MGKTHLLQAIGNKASENLKVLYASGEQYTNEFVSALKERRTEEFRTRYRSAEMLLIDDVSFITGKEQTEESLYHTIDELENSSRQVVLTCDRVPSAMNQMSKRLKSRMEGGLVADIQLPDYETRLHILEAKAREKGLEITDDTLELMAQNIRQSIRELEGSLNRVVAYAHLLRSKITPELAAQALENIAAKPNNPSPFSTRLLIEAVADSFQLTVVDLQSKRRDKETARARQVAMYVLRQEMHCSLAQIGEELGGRNPATVTYSCQKVASELVSDSYLQTRLADIQQRIEKSGGK